MNSWNMQEFSNFLSHPFVNTVCALLFGTFAALLIAQRWQSNNQKHVFMQAFSSELNEVKRSIRVVRRKYRRAKVSVGDALDEISNIESKLRGLQENVEVTMGRSRRASIMAAELGVSADYFREISQELERASVDDANRGVVPAFVGDRFESFILPKTDEYKNYVLTPISDAKRMLLLELQRIS